MTIAMLLRNTLEAARASGRRAGLMGRLRDGEWIAGAGGVALLAVAVPALVRADAGVRRAGPARLRRRAGRRSRRPRRRARRCSRSSRSRWSCCRRRARARRSRSPSASSPSLAGALATLLILYRIAQPAGPERRASRSRPAPGSASRPRGARRAGGWRSLRVEAIPGVAAPAGRGPPGARALSRRGALRARRARRGPAVHLVRGRNAVSTLGIVLMLARRRARGGGGARAVARRARRGGRRRGRGAGLALVVAGAGAGHRGGGDGRARPGCWPRATSLVVRAQGAGRVARAACAAGRRA